MALYIPHSIFYLARLLYVRPETFGPYYIFLTFRLNSFETKRVLKKCYMFLKHSVLYMLICYTASVEWRATRSATAGIRSITAARTCKILQTGSGDNSGSSPTHGGEYLPGDDAAGAGSWLLSVMWCQDLLHAINIHAIRCGWSTEPLFRVTGRWFMKVASLTVREHECKHNQLTNQQPTN